MKSILNFKFGLTVFYYFEFFKINMSDRIAPDIPKEEVKQHKHHHHHHHSHDNSKLDMSDPSVYI